MNLAQYVLELLEAIAWHHLAFVFAIIFIYKFRLQIAALIDRTRKIGREGLSADPIPDKQQDKIESDSQAAQKLLDLVDNTPVINDQVNRINEDLKSREILIAEDRALVLTKYLAGTQILLAFEKIYTVIFRSQITLLEMLNENRGRGINIITVDTHINLIKADFPETMGKWTNEQYLKFLCDNFLIMKTGDNIHITDLGIEFLTWLAREGRTQHKVF